MTIDNIIEGLEAFYKVLTNSQFLEQIKDIMLGTVGGFIAYLFDYSKARRAKDTSFVFRFSSMLINMALGGFVAYCVGAYLPIDVEGRNAIIALSGVFGFNILLLAESNIASGILGKATNIFKK